MTSSLFPRFSPTRIMVTRLSSSFTEKSTRYFPHTRSSFWATLFGRKVFKFLDSAKGLSLSSFRVFRNKARPVFFPKKRSCSTAASFTTTIQAMAGYVNMTKKMVKRARANRLALAADRLRFSFLSRDDDAHVSSILAFGISSKANTDIGAFRVEIRESEKLLAMRCGGQIVFYDYVP